jgi:hypothetical protein
MGMARISTKSLLVGGLVGIGVAGAWRYLSGHRAAQEARDDILSTTNPLLAGPLYTDPGQRPMVDEPPDDPVDALPLGLA